MSAFLAGVGGDLRDEGLPNARVLRLSAHSCSNEGLLTTLDSPDRGLYARNIASTEVTVEVDEKISSMKLALVVRAETAYFDGLSRGVAEERDDPRLQLP